MLSIISAVLFLSLTAASVLGAPAAGRPNSSESVAPLAFSLNSVHAPKIFRDMNSHSLRLDSAKLPHVAYGADHLYYASYNGTTWDIQTVDASAGVGAYASLALGSDDTPHISYYDAVRGALKYATRIGGTWYIQTVDSLPRANMSAAALQDLDPTQPLAGPAEQRAWSQANLNTVIASEDSVQTETTEGIGRYSSIAVDAFNHPSISYYDAKNGDLKYAHWTGSAWDIQTVDSDYNVGAYNSLAMDKDGNPYISYYDVTNQDLRFARWTGVKWAYKLVDSGGNVGLYTSIAVDGSKRAYISYYDATNGNLKYAYYSGTSYTIQTVDIAGTDYTGYFTSIGLNNFNPPRP